MTRPVVSYGDIHPELAEDHAGPSKAAQGLGLQSPRGSEKLSYSAKKRLRRARTRAQEQGQKKNKKPKQEITAGNVTQGGQDESIGRAADQEAGPSTVQAIEQSVTQDLGATYDETDECYAEGGYYDDDGTWWEADGNDTYFNEDDDDDDDDADYDIPEMINTSIIIPDAPHLPTGKSSKPQVTTKSPHTGLYEENSRGRVLTQDEVWQDTAFTGAWEAAMAECTSFQKGLSVEAATSSSSALWHEAPTPGTPIAQKARDLNEANKERRRLQSWLEEKKKKLSAAATGDAGATTATQKGAVNGKASKPMDPSIPPGLTLSAPPSSHLPGNAAWRAACAIVASTPNRVGAIHNPQDISSNRQIGGPGSRTALSQTEQPAPAFPSHPYPPILPSSLPKGSTSQSEAFHSICMSWYNAGYYTAQWEMAGNGVDGAGDTGPEG